MFWYTGENGSTPAAQTAEAQVGSVANVAYGMRATEPAIASLLANVAVLAVSSYSPSDPNAQASYQALSQSVQQNLSGQPGTQTISDLEANMASAQTAITNAGDTEHSDAKHRAGFAAGHGKCQSDPDRRSIF